MSDFEGLIETMLKKLGDDPGRAGLRRTLDQALLRGERDGTVAAAEGQFQSAMNLLTATEIRDAFDISLESSATRDEYGRTKIGEPLSGTARPMVFCRTN